MKTHKLVTAEADIVYDVYGPLPTADGRPPLFMIGGRIPRVLITTRLLLAPIRRFWMVVSSGAKRSGERHSG